MRRALAVQRPRGFALVAALFLIVTLAALGAFAVRINGVQRQNADLELLGARAQAAARAGIEYAASRLQPPGTCNDLTANFNVVDGFQVTLACPLPPSQSVVNGAPVNVFSVTSTATRGAYGTPEFVSRSITVRVTI